MQSRTMNQTAISIIHHAYGQSEVEKALFLEERKRKELLFMKIGNCIWSFMLSQICLLPESNSLQH